MTVVLIIFLLFGGMNLFESIVHALGTAGTGGFGVKNDSIVSYNNYIQWVIAIFMLLFGVNFNLYYLLLLKKFTTVFKSTELKTYFLIVTASIIIICFDIYPLYNNLEQTIRLSIFQTSSIITTTGFSTADFNVWPTLSKSMLFELIVPYFSVLYSSRQLRLPKTKLSQRSNPQAQTVHNFSYFCSYFAKNLFQLK